jgi:Secretion system C-terminal sorting domain
MNGRGGIIYLTGRTQMQISHHFLIVDNDGTYENSYIVEASVSVPDKFMLGQNYPNPFNPGTVISYSLPSPSNVKLILYNTIGLTVKVLENEFKDAGNYSVNFNASELSSGIYFYRLQAGSFNETKKMMLLK